MRRGWGWGGWGVWAGLWAAALLLVAAAADLIFHVPEVLVRHAAVPRPVGSVRGNGSRFNESDWPAGDGLVHASYQYFVEHRVSTDQAKKAAAELHVQKSEPGPGCGACSAREMEYCESAVVADHCCCERRYVREPFPWLPHTCYLGAERCRPVIGNCAFYVRLRDCCCANKLALHWKGILSSAAARSGAGGAVPLAALGALALALAV